MQNINSLIGRVAQSIESMRQSPPAQQSAREQKRYNVRGEYLTAMEILWRRMTELYGHRWTSGFGDAPTDGWTLAVGALPPEMIRAGLERMVRQGKHNDWPPTALEFRALCLPCSEDLGLPSEDAAYRQAVDWSRLSAADRHPAVLATLRQLDTWAWRRLDEQTARKQFAAAWQKIVDRVRAEGEGWLPEVPQQIEYQPAATPAPRDTALHALAGILGNL